VEQGGATRFSLRLGSPQNCAIYGNYLYTHWVTSIYLSAVSRGATYDKMKEVSQVFVSMGFYLVFKISICLFT
jgi:hypothetical protein